ncbi:MAG: glycosyltransferase family 2 protein [Actinobacteria bacterium]|nr:MAG: glycosyltransferase family 2 protein [Actinomycetota bacterium]
MADTAPAGPGLHQPSVADVHAVIVNHNSGRRLGPLLDALLPQVRSAAVVDNGSTDGSLDDAEGREAVRVVRNPDNRGFAAAANQGATTGGAEWLLFVNPDIYLDPGQVATLVRDAPGDVAAFAPLQVDERGRPRSETGGYDPTLLRYLVWAVLPVRWHGRSGPWLAPPFPSHDEELGWVSGALLAIRRPVFERLGGFDERFFLYHEDVDFCRRARRDGYRILCRPAVRIHHEVAHGDPARRVLSGRRSVESLALDFAGWRLRALGAVLGLGFGLRALFASGTTRQLARAVLPHCRALMAGRSPHREGMSEGPPPPG